MNPSKIIRELFVRLTVSSAIILLTLSGMDSTYTQTMSMSTTSNSSNNTGQQYAEHILDNLVISEHIPLTGQLASGDYILLMDFTPFVTSIEGHSHIALKVPCNSDGTSKVTVVAGIAPNLNTLNIGNAIHNGTLNGSSNLDLSDEGRSCLYHAELPNGITDISLVNTSNETLSFDEGGYSVTVSAHGTAIQHIGSNQTKASS